MPPPRQGRLLSVTDCSLLGFTNQRRPCSRFRTITEGINPIGVNCFNSVTFIIAIKLGVALFVFGAKLAFESRQTRDLRDPKIIENPINVLSGRLETDNFPPFIQLATQCGIDSCSLLVLDKLIKLGFPCEGSSLPKEMRDHQLEGISNTDNFC